MANHKLTNTQLKKLNSAAKKLDRSNIKNNQEKLSRWRTASSVFF